MPAPVSNVSRSVVSSGDAQSMSLGNRMELWDDVDSTIVPTSPGVTAFSIPKYGCVFRHSEYLSMVTIVLYLQWHLESGGPDGRRCRAGARAESRKRDWC
jgi:hypothetical protein